MSLKLTELPKIEQLNSNDLLYAVSNGVSSAIEKKDLLDHVSVKDFGAVGDGVTNDTTSIQDAINASKSVYFPDGVYLVTENVITLSDGVKMYGEGTIKNTYVNNPLPNFRQAAMLTVTTNNIIDGLKFEGVDNKVYGIGGVADNGLECKNIIIKNCQSDKCGIAIFSPLDGFTKNLYNEPFVDWYTSGKIESYHKCDNIKVINCSMIGDSSYNANSGTTNDSRVSGVVFFYCTNSSAVSIDVEYSRFGVWAYGGAPKNDANTDLSFIDNESQNIRFDKVSASNIYSAAWMANVNDGTIINSFATNFEDAQIDFEGCERCIGCNNTIVDTLGKGQFLTALNGCNDILFSNNNCRTLRIGNIILIRDGNSNITYSNNNIRGVGAGSSIIKIFNDLSGITQLNTNIIINDNVCYNFDVESEISNGVSILNNTYNGDPRKEVIRIVDTNNVQIIGNSIGFNSDFTSSDYNDSPIQILKGANTQTHNNTVVNDNKIFNCTEEIGVFIFIDKNNNDIKFMNNICNAVYVENSFINIPPNGTKGNFVSFNNFSTLADSDHTPATPIKRTNNTYKFSPTVLIGATGVGSLTGTFRVGDKIYITTPTAGGKIGWVCVTAGTPGTWKQFGAIDA